VLGVLLALAFLVESAWQTWSAVHLERDLRASAGLASVGPAVFGASAGIGRVLVHRWAVPGREAGLVALGAVVAAGASVAAALVPDTGLVIVAIAFAGLGTAAGAPLLLSLAGRSVSVHQAGAAVGTVTTLGYLGFVVAPAAVGGLAGATTLPVALAAVALSAVALAGGTAALAREPVSGRRS
jgi:MFS family permease